MEAKTAAAARPRPVVDRAAPERPDVASIATLTMAQAMARMTPSRIQGALAVLQYMARPRARDAVEDVVETLCHLLIEAGVPLDRYGSSTTMVTSDYDAVGRIWLRDQGVEKTIYVGGGASEEDPDYLTSPYYAAAQSRRWVEIWLPETPDERFGIVPLLKAQGFVHYLCIPSWLSNGANSWSTFATRDPRGFSEQDVLTIVFILPALVARIDSRAGWMTLDSLLRTYVGDEPHTAILAGRAKRGQVSTIEAAMLVADMRDSTGQTATLTAVQAVDLFNELFDCLVPPIETRRGEVLKYLGDGLLGMFRETDYAGTASDRALDAADAALAAVAARNAAAPDRRPIEIGIALHFGEIAYGNVGSGSRLDFTVIGRDVALATRIAGMNARLSQPLLLSASFAQRISRPASRIGLYPLRGFAEPVEVFRPVPRPDDAADPVGEDR